MVNQDKSGSTGLNRALWLGWVVIAALFVVEVVEYFVGVAMDSGAFLFMVLLAVPGGGLIVWYFMHVKQLWSNDHADAAPAEPGHGGVGMNRLGLWVFIISESFLFAALLSSRYFLRGVERPDDLNQILGLGISVVLLLSSLTAFRAEAAAEYGDQGRFKRNMLFTLGLGLVFLVGVSVEWAEAFRHFPPDSAFGTIFFTMTGIHAFHVLTGMLVLGFVYNMGRDGRYCPGNYWGVEGSVKYWHFVDLAWVLIYPTLYLVS